MGKITRLLRLNLKQRFGRFAVAVILVLVLIIILMYLPALTSPGMLSQSAIRRGLPALLRMMLVFSNIFIIFQLASSTVYPMVLSTLRAEADFVLTTPEDPRLIFTINVATLSLSFTPTFLVLSIPTIIPTALITGWYVLGPYIISVLSLSAILVGVGTYIYYASTRVRLTMMTLVITYLVATLILAPRLNPLYGVLTGNPVYAVVYLAVASVMIIDMVRRYSQELYINIYGLVPTTMPRLSRLSAVEANVAVSSRLPRTPWGLIWWTSVHGTNITRAGGVNVVKTTNWLRILIPASVISSVIIIAAVPLTRLFMSPSFSQFTPLLVSLISSFSVVLLELVFLSVSIMNERVWVNFVNVDPVKYLRMRMGARLIMAYIGLAPIAAALMILYALTHSIAPLGSVISLLASPPLLSVASWALARTPQVTDATFQVRPIKVDSGMMLSSIIALIILSLITAPSLTAVIVATIHISIMALVASAVAALGVSITTYVVLLYTGLSRTFVDWLLEKLVADSGYV